MTSLSELKETLTDSRKYQCVYKSTQVFTNDVFIKLSTAQTRRKRSMAEITIGLHEIF